MSITSTKTITRKRALEILLTEIPTVSNHVLEQLMDALADTKQSKLVSVFDNFIVSDIPPEGDEP